MKGEYLATKYGDKLKLAYYLWISFLVFDLTVSMIYLVTPQVIESVYISAIFQSLLELFSTLLFIAAYEFIATSEILVRITVGDRENLSNTISKEFADGKLSSRNSVTGERKQSFSSFDGYGSMNSTSTLHHEAKPSKEQNTELSKIREQLYDLLD